ncbi:MAG: tetratricopeptide repeat protein [Balneolaceae bacterium]
MGLQLRTGAIILFLTFSGFSPYLFSQEVTNTRCALIQQVDSVNALSFQDITTRTAEAEALFLRNIALADSLNYREAVAKSYKNLSLAYYYQGKYDLSTEYNIKALSLFEELGLFKEAALQYSSYGYSIKRRNLDDAEFYLRKGIAISEAFEDSAALVDSYNWYGVIKEFRQQLDSALFFYERSFEIKEILGDSLGLAYSYGNIAGINILQKNYDDAFENLEKAFEISVSVKDSSLMAVNLHNISTIFIAQEKWQQAIPYLHQSLAISQEINYIALTRASYDFITQSFEATGNLDSALHYQKIYLEYNDNYLNEINTNKIAELEIQFKTEEKEKDLAINRAKLTQEQLKVRQRNWMVAGMTGFLFFGMVISLIIFKQQKTKQKIITRENALKIQLAKSEMANKIHEERERISRDLHDNVGAHITNLIAGIEISNLHIKRDEKNEALGLLTHLDDNARFAMSELRETIWLLDKDEVQFKDFITHLKSYLDHQRHALSKLQVVVKNEVDTEMKLNPQQSLHLLRIIQEALNNTRKYANADTFTLQLNFDNENLYVALFDDGAGALKDEIMGNGNGLTNMERRVKELKGSLEINTSTNEGFSVKIYFPVA